jgi:hypothetical protein
MPDEKIDEKRPAHADNELRKMQQRLVDDTVDDSFPASDPPAWTTTGAKSVAARHDADENAETSKEPNVDQQDSGTVQHTIDQASNFANEAYRRGGEYVRQARRRFPEAGHYSRRGTQAVARPVQQYPLIALLAAAAAGYGLAWLIHSRATTIQHTFGETHRSMTGRRRAEHDENFPATEPQGSGDSPKPHGDKYADVIQTTADHQSRL